jgi:hypothetical protein
MFGAFIIVGGLIGLYFTIALTMFDENNNPRAFRFKNINPLPLVCLPLVTGIIGMIVCMIAMEITMDDATVVEELQQNDGNYLNTVVIDDQIHYVYRNQEGRLTQIEPDVVTLKDTEERPRIVMECADWNSPPDWISWPFPPEKDPIECDDDGENYEDSIIYVPEDEVSMELEHQDID